MVHTDEVWGHRWIGVPRRVRAIVALLVIVFGYGTAVHLSHLLAGPDPYPSMPQWLAAYFMSLTLLDPAAALLLAWRRQAGLLLAGAVLVTDAYANYVVDHAEGVTAGRIGTAVLAVLAIALLTAMPWLRRACRPPVRPPRRAARSGG